MASPSQNLEQPVSKRRRTTRIVLAAIIVLLFLINFSESSLNLSFIRPDTLSQTLVFAALSALILLLFIALTFVLARNLLRLYAERRIGVLGSAFRARMVIGALAISFLPVIFLFLFAYGLMNRSIDKWFSRPVQVLQEDTARLGGLLKNYAAANAQAEAATLADSSRVKRALAGEDTKLLDRVFRHHDATLQGGFVLLLKGDAALASYHAPGSWLEMRNVILPALPVVAEPAEIDSAVMGERPPATVLWAGVPYFLGTVEAGPGNRVVVGLPLPQNFSETLKKMEASQSRYEELSAQRKQVRRFYIQLLLLLTVLTLFAATWLSLFMARLVTRPVSALAEATREISQGHLDYRVQVTAADELGELVTSFNRMAGELEQNRSDIEASREELANTNRALSAANVSIEQRRKEIETILQNVPTGVLSLDAQGRVSHSNRAFVQMFVRPEKDMQIRQIFDGPIASDLERLLRRADRLGTASGEFEIKGHAGTLQVEITAASLQHGRQRLGYVIVFEDLSELLKAQKQVAWREVARRVAHEIKNPLTPIALSAERIRRHLERGSVPDSASIAVIDGCVDTITGAVETMRTLVDEFATLARFPAARPQPSNLNSIVESAVNLFHDRLAGIIVETELAAGLPDVMADPESIKRVVANLIDNAAEAMRESLIREIHISTVLVDERDSVELTVSDTGHGVTSELKEKLFLPYFSTKERGTGLGLAIVNRIVEEHHGSVRLEPNSPVGTKFIVELPVAAAVETRKEASHA